MRFVVVVVLVVPDGASGAGFNPNLSITSDANCSLSVMLDIFMLDPASSATLRAELSTFHEFFSSSKVTATFLPLIST